MAEHLWYILLNQKQFGPYTFQELKGISSVTPDTLCWREGMKGWMPIRDVPELKNLFKEDPVPEEEVSVAAPSEDLALTLSPSLPPYYLWLILLILVILYVFFQIN